MNLEKEKFVALDTLDTDIISDIRYAGSNNFMGKKIEGYEKQRCFLSLALAEPLLKVQSFLKEQDLSLKIFDAYRPQRSVDFIFKWAQNKADIAMQKRFYPNVNKENLFEGYFSDKSGHSRGASVDLTLVDKTGQELDMGTEFDFLDLKSHTQNLNISKVAQLNRLKLKVVMENHGFENYHKEWWHYSLLKEPYPNTYFDFVIE